MSNVAYKHEYKDDKKATPLMSGVISVNLLIFSQFIGEY